MAASSARKCSSPSSARGRGTGKVSTRWTACTVRGRRLAEVASVGETEAAREIASYLMPKLEPRAKGIAQLDVSNVVNTRDDIGLAVVRGGAARWLARFAVRQHDAPGPPNAKKRRTRRRFHRSGYAFGFKIPRGVFDIVRMQRVHALIFFF